MWIFANRRQTEIRSGEIKRRKARRYSTWSQWVRLVGNYRKLKLETRIPHNEQTEKEARYRLEGAWNSSTYTIVHLTLLRLSMNAVYYVNLPSSVSSLFLLFKCVLVFLLICHIYLSLCFFSSHGSFHIRQPFHNRRKYYRIGCNLGARRRWQRTRDSVCQ